MTSRSSMKIQPPATPEALGGCWKLASGRAMTLQPREAGVLRINAGQVWATLDGPHTGPANDWGDLFLTKGQRLDLQPGQRVVIESRGDAVNRSTYFEWEPTSVRQDRTVGNTSRWQMAVVQPARDMGAALVLVMGAARRLASGLLGYSEFAVAGRGRVLTGLESNQP